LRKKFDAAKESNKNIDKLLEKRRKRKAAKEHKNVPFKRRRPEDE
jgi:hypothetical protein